MTYPYDRLSAAEVSGEYDEAETLSDQTKGNVVRDVVAESVSDLMRVSDVHDEAEEMQNDCPKESGGGRENGPDDLLVRDLCQQEHKRHVLVEGVVIAVFYHVSAATFFLFVVQRTEAISNCVLVGHDRGLYPFLCLHAHRDDHCDLHHGNGHLHPGLVQLGRNAPVAQGVRFGGTNQSCHFALYLRDGGLRRQPSIACL